MHEFAELKIVFPTPVGMVRKEENQEIKGQSFPHARGDGPK